MKSKFVLFLFSFLIMLNSCIKGPVCAYKDQNVAATAAEIAYLQQYFADNGIADVVQHSSGVFYRISQQGSGRTPNLCSSIVVNYGAFRLGTGVAFDSNYDPDGISFILGELIVGIQKTLPLIQEGGSITLYIPPSLAYGSSVQQDQNGTIILPANSYIKFNMDVLSVN